MPKKNGLQVFQEVKYFYSQIRDFGEDDIEVLEPKIVFLTSYATPVFRKHIAQLGCQHCYEKPLQLEELREILTLWNYTVDIVI